MAYSCCDRDQPLIYISKCVCQYIWLIIGLGCLIYGGVCICPSAIIEGHSNIIYGGILSGGFHALTGPDHLAALLPSILGKSWYLSLFLGCVWGAGHSVSSSFLAGCGYVLEDTVLRRDGSWMTFAIKFSDIAIALTLIAIGLLGMSECETAETSEKERTNESTEETKAINSSEVSEEEQPTNSIARLFSHCLSQYIAPKVPSSFPNLTSPNAQLYKLFALTSTIFLNGLLLGLCWDGLPSLAPALSADSYNELFLFILAYGIGTTLSMGITAGAIGLLSTWIGIYMNETVPIRLAYITSVICLIVGAIWILQAALKMAFVQSLLEKFIFRGSNSTNLCLYTSLCVDGIWIDMIFPLGLLAVVILLSYSSIVRISKGIENHKISKKELQEAESLIHKV